MHARVSIFEAENPEQVDGMLRQVREVVLSQAKQMDGFKGLIHPSAWNRYSRKFRFTIVHRSPSERHEDGF
jgi:hypothetical protein